ncbi:sulfotransferase family protein [Serinicoccus hydrothermalis]|uniref:sulfotransferase family protein n=1 Tax=Serinicoccus hydrothermalis TaxID=1758689 RepID=UPI0008315FFB|nr:sulfotransferase [Serinicoccus hydrothermalis]
MARNAMQVRLMRLKESARRAYGEVIRGRTRVRVIHASVAVSNTPARFVLSPYRSGTTLLRYCLDSHPDLAVPPETDFMAPIAQVMADDASMAGYRDLGYEEVDVRRLLSQAARNPLDTYAEGRGAASGWADKSPRYAEMPDGIRTLFPDAAFLVMQRHPLDQIHSFTKGGTVRHPALGSQGTGEELVLSAARYWATLARGLRSFAVDHPRQTLSIRYEDLCAHPDDTLHAVTDHFGLTWSPDVLDYHDHDHDLGREAGRVAGTRGFSLSTGGWRSWPDSWSSAAWSVVADEAEPLGYRAEGV